MLETADQNLTRPSSGATAATREPADPFGTLGESSTADDLVESIITWSHDAVGPAELIEARDRFFVTHGKTVPEDAFYDARMSYFFDHFIFERPLTALPNGLSTTPYELFLARARQSEATLPQVVTKRLTELGDSRHSLYEITKVAEHQLVVRDLLTDDRLDITPRANENFRGLAKGQMLQAFAYAHAGQRLLSPGIVLHHAKVGRVVRKHLKQERKQGELARRSVLAKLAHVQMRCLRHQHVAPAAIYRSELLDK